MKRFFGLTLSFALCVPSLASSAHAPTQSNTSATVLTIAVSASPADQGNPDVRVWANSNSGVYHCPGTRWYGKTKHGEYMAQAEAQKRGYRPAYGKVCW